MEKGINLTRQSIEQTEDQAATAGAVAPGTTSSLDTSATHSGNNPVTDRGGHRRRRNALADEIGTKDNGEPTDENADATRSPRSRDGRRLERESRRHERRARPRAPRAEHGTASLLTDSQTVEAASGDSISPEQGLTATEKLTLDLAPESKRTSHRLARARKKQRSATAAVAAAEDNPALGALNRHLNMLMHQLATAHRVIGRIAAERDALRQQLADLQGIPIEEISVTTIGASSFEEQSAKPSTRRDATSPASGTSSLVAKLNYFNAEDIAVARKRRQMLALILLSIIVALWVTARIGWWSMPANFNRDSLGNLPYIGDFVTLFLAGWIFFRAFRISSRGVRWVFPSDDQRRRRR